MGSLGFPQDSSSTNKVAAGRCGSIGYFWETDNSRIYKNGTQLHVVMRDTEIGRYFFNNQADVKFGLPHNDEGVSGAYHWQDFYVTRLALWWPGGTQEIEGSEYCPDERLQAWEVSLKNAINRVKPNSYNRTLQQQFCTHDNLVSHTIEGGVMLIDKTTSQTTQFKGDIYTYWNANGACDRLGVPIETNYSMSYKTTRGEFIRFRKDSRTIDVYSSNFGTFELEGGQRNEYIHSGGVGKLGFIKSTNNTYNAKCGEKGTFTNIQNGRMYSTTNGWKTVVADTKIGRYYFSNGADRQFGIPTTNEYYHFTRGIQEFNNVLIVHEFGNTWEENYTNCDGENVEQVRDSCTDETMTFSETLEKCIPKKPPVCGDGIVDQGEVCDDGNTLDGDKCSSTCQNKCEGGEIWNGEKCVIGPSIKSKKDHYLANESLEFEVRLPSGTTHYYLHLTINEDGFSDPDISKYINVYWENAYKPEENYITINDTILLHSGNQTVRKLFYRIDAINGIELDQNKRLSSVNSLTFETRRIPSDKSSVKLDPNALKDLAFPYAAGTNVYTCQGQNISYNMTHNPNFRYKFKYALDLMVNGSDSDTAGALVISPVNGTVLGSYEIGNNPNNLGIQIQDGFGNIIEIDHLQSIETYMKDYGKQIKVGDPIGITTFLNLGGCVHLHLHIHNGHNPIPLEYGKWNLRTNEESNLYHHIYLKF